MCKYISWASSRGSACRWGLGVLMYVLLTGRQPFSSPKTDDPMVIMRRIVDESFDIKYPPYLSSAAKVGQGRRQEGGGCPAATRSHAGVVL